MNQCFISFNPCKAKQAIGVCCFLFISFCSFSQYTLNFNDVEVHNGTIVSYINPVEKDIIIPNILNGDTITHIGERAFEYLQLTSVSLPNTIESIGYGAFNGNELVTVDFGQNSKLKFIGGSAFGYNLLTRVNLPDSLSQISFYAFASNNLDYVSIPRNVELLGYYAFYGNDLTHVTIQDSSLLKHIGHHCFSSNPALGYVYFPSRGIPLIDYWERSDEVRFACQSYFTEFGRSHTAVSPSHKKLLVINLPPITAKSTDLGPFQLNVKSNGYFNLDYYSSDPSVATVSNGVVTILSEGETKITAAHGGNYEYFGSEKSQWLTVDNSILGTDNSLVEKKVSISPNPVSNRLRIMLSNDDQFVNADIINLSGEIIKTVYRNEFSVEGFPKGAYFIKVFTSEAAYSELIIVQ